MYGCAVWHYGLTVAQSRKLKSLQKRALRIIHQTVCDMPYDSTCAFAGVQPLSARRYELWRRFFRFITQSDMTSVTTRLAPLIATPRLPWDSCNM